MKEAVRFTGDRCGDEGSQTDRGYLQVNVMGNVPTRWIASFG